MNDVCLRLGETTEGRDRRFLFYGLTTIVLFYGNHCWQDADADRHQHCSPKKGSHAEVLSAHRMFICVRRIRRATHNGTMIKNAKTGVLCVVGRGAFRVVNSTAAEGRLSK